MKKWEIRSLGGSGSGNYGHKGRPGKRGGSASTSGFSIREGDFDKDQIDLINGTLSKMPQSHTQNLDIIGTTLNRVEPGTMGNYDNAPISGGPARMLLLEVDEDIVLHELGHHMQHTSGAFLLKELDAGEVDVTRYMTDLKTVEQNYWMFGLSTYEGTGGTSERFVGLYRVRAKAFLGQKESTDDFKRAMEQVPYMAGRVDEFFKT